MNVTRLYTKPDGNGYLALTGNVPDDALRLRSGAALFIHMDGNKIYTGTTGEELYQKVKAEKFLVRDEILHFKLDFHRKMTEAKRIEWKE